MNKNSKTIENNSPFFEFNSVTTYIFTACLALTYFVFSLFSDGFYQHDEVANFLGAQTIWYDDLINIVGANSKAGYKLLYSVPALGGFTFLKLFNSIVAALTVFFSYKLLKKIGSKNSVLIFLLLGVQPLWFMLSFRNYAELTVSFLLVASLLLLYNKKFILSALIISFAAFTRQEYHLVLICFFIAFLMKKQYLAAILTGTFTFLQNLIGFIITGDILFLPHTVMEFSEKIKGVWPKQGFDHYFIMSNVIFGSAVLTLFIAYIALMILNKKKPNWMLVSIAFIIFLLNCAFNSQSFSFGPGNGGNLRYLMTIAPIVGIISVLALDEVSLLKKRYLLLLFLTPLIVLVGMYQTYEHLNYGIRLSDQRFWLPLIFMLLVTILLIIPIKLKQRTIGIAIVSILIALTQISTRRIQPEEETIQKAAKWYKRHTKPGKNQIFTNENRIVCNHVLFYYYLDKNKNQFEKEPIMRLTKEVTDSLQKGDIVIWESHYGYRPKLRPTSQPYDFYDKNESYQKIQYYQSKDKRFMIVFFQKIKD